MQMTRCTRCMEELEEGARICPHCGYEQDDGSQPPNALKRNTILHGRYYIGNVIGRGGFGITYVGFDLVLEARVAVKEYFPSDMASRTNSYSSRIQWNFTENGEKSWAEGIERFLKEAQKMAKLDSVPSIVRVRDAFSDNQTAYIVMDFVEGITLKQHVQEYGALGYEECMNLLTPILDSLAVIHSYGLLHRDISPDNIMLQTDGQARLLDMGAAVDVRSGGGRASMAVAKQYFSAPEQYMESEALGSWTDVYAMAATIYYCMTGKTVPEALERGIRKTPVSFDLGLNIPAHVQKALIHALEMNASDRIRDMQELKKELESTGKNRAAAGDSKKRLKIVLITAGILSFLLVPALMFRSTHSAGVPVTTVADQTDEASDPLPETTEQETVAISQYDEVKASELLYKRTEDERGIVLTYYEADEEEPYIKLPDEIDGLPVLELAEKLFEENRTLEGVILPDHLEIIGDYAFYLCTNLKYLELPEGLRKIGSFAFRASGLKELRIPSAVNEMDGTILYGMEIKIAEKNDAYRMVDGIIYSANGLGLIAFPSTIEGRYEISSEVKSIGKYAFYNTSLADITIPGSVLKVGEHAFDHGEKLEKVVIEEGTYLLNHYAFLGCKSLSDVTIPKSVMVIGKMVFTGCDNLESVTINKKCALYPLWSLPGIDVKRYD